jgi:hypothetical protein
MRKKSREIQATRIYSLRDYQLSGTVLDSEGTPLNKTNENPSPMDLLEPHTRTQAKNTRNGRAR